MQHFIFKRCSRLLKGLPEIITVCKLAEQLSIRAGSDQSIRTWMRFSRRRGVSPRSFNVALAWTMEIAKSGIGLINSHLTNKIDDASSRGNLVMIIAAFVHYA